MHSQYTRGCIEKNPWKSLENEGFSIPPRHWKYTRRVYFKIIGKCTAFPYLVGMEKLDLELTIQ